MTAMREGEDSQVIELDSIQEMSNSVTEIHVRVEKMESGLSSMESGLVSVQSELQNLAEAKRYESATMNKLGSQMASIQTQIKLLADSLPQHVSPILNGAPSHQPRYVPPPRRIDQVRQLSSEHRRSSRSAPALRENILKPIDMPVFNGAYPYGWIMRLERFFRIGNISEEKKLGLVSLCFEGDALIWFNEQKNQDSFATWHEFKFRLYARFGTIKNRTSQELTLTKGSLYSKNEVHETVLSQTTQPIIEVHSLQEKESFVAELILGSETNESECIEEQNVANEIYSIQEVESKPKDTELVSDEPKSDAESKSTLAIDCFHQQHSILHLAVPVFVLETSITVCNDSLEELPSQIMRNTRHQYQKEKKWLCVTFLLKQHEIWLFVVCLLRWFGNNSGVTTSKKRKLSKNWWFKYKDNTMNNQKSEQYTFQDIICVLDELVRHSVSVRKKGFISTLQKAELLLFRAETHWRTYIGSLISLDSANVNRQLYFSVWPCWRKKNILTLCPLEKSRLNCQKNAAKRIPATTVSVVLCYNSIHRRESGCCYKS